MLKIVSKKRDRSIAKWEAEERKRYESLTKINPVCTLYGFVYYVKGWSWIN